MNLSAPSPGQLVTVRQRRYVVTGVLPSSNPSESGTPDHHLVELSSVEDGAWASSFASSGSWSPAAA